MTESEEIHSIHNIYLHAGTLKQAIHMGRRVTLSHFHR